MPTDDPHPSEGPQAGVPGARPLPAPWRWLLLLLACVSLATGVVGLFVPGLPTTVFVLIAAWAAARSSPRLHRWLLAHRVFGRLIQDWQAGGCVSRRAKWNATLAMAVCAAVLLWLNSRWWVSMLACGCMGAVLCWLWLRPEPVPR
ncbi:YbaN family protein [Pseudorhodoferax aquiterrae]|uniref:YbaN family protein n=1 Tax=Pseudorhodoferax aquiterrae TaxID=747304 RepID=UPI00167837D8|nr:YbaN family protein [Pseudorhodoferax aquiterrae]